MILTIGKLVKEFLISPIDVQPQGLNPPLKHYSSRRIFGYVADVGKVETGFGILEPICFPAI